MKAKLATSALIVATLLAAVPAYAHHSFAAEFDGSKPTRLVGKITRVEWTNPHSYFYVDVSDAKGKITNWGCEGAGPGALSRILRTSKPIPRDWPCVRLPQIYWTIDYAP